MSKPCPKFRSRYMPVTDLFWSSFIQRELVYTHVGESPGQTMLLPGQEPQPAPNPMENLYHTFIFYPKKQHNFTVLWRTGRGKSDCLSLGISWQSSINSNLTFYAWWSDERVGREEYFCFVKNFCCQSRTTMERSLQTDSTPIFEELYFLQILSSHNLNFYTKCLS